MNTIEQAAKRLAELKRAGFDVPVPEIPGAAAASPVPVEAPAAVPVEAPVPVAAAAETKIAPVKPAAGRSSDGALRVWGNLAAQPLPASISGASALTVHIDDATFGQVSAIVGGAAAYLPLGQGCAGSRAASRLVPHDVPRLGQELQIRAFDLPANLAVLVSGLSTANSTWVPLPLELTSFGMPGCWLYVSVDASEVLVGTNGTAMTSLQVPADGTLLGLRLHHQALVLDANAGNAFGAVVSDAMTAVVGS